MTQRATVDAVLDNGYARVSVARTSACGHSCAECGAGCMGEKRTLQVLARNAAGARAGDSVTIQTATGRVLGAAALIYLLPIVLCIAVGVILYDQARPEGVCIAGSIAAFIAGAAAAALINKYIRRDRAMDYDIIAVEGGYASEHGGAGEESGN